MRHGRVLSTIICFCASIAGLAMQHVAPLETETKPNLQISKCTTGIQIRRGTLEEETKRCSSFPAASPSLGIPSTSFGVPCVPSHSSRQGPPARLQGKTRILHLPFKGSPRWKEASSFQGTFAMLRVYFAYPIFSLKARCPSGRMTRMHGPITPPPATRHPPSNNRASVMASRSIKALKN